MRDHIAAPLAAPAPPALACGARAHAGPALAATVARLARGLQSLGLRPGDRVAVLTGPVPGGAPYPADACLATVLAAAAAGAVAAPLAARAPVGDLAAWLALVRPACVCAGSVGVLKHAAAAVAVAAAAEADDVGPPSHGLPLGPATPKLVLLDVWGASAVDEATPSTLPPCIRASTFPAASTLPLLHAPADAAAIVFTSGSSGAPRAALLTHAALCFQSCIKIERLGLDAPDACTLAPAPLSHVGGLSTALAALAGGGGVVLLEAGWSGAAAVASIAAHRVTTASIVPTMALDIASAAATASASGLSQRAAVATALRGVRSILIGGGAPPPRAALRAAFPAAAVHTAYGLTEAASSVLWGRAGGDNEPAPAAAAGAPPAGAPPPGVAAVVAVCEDGADPTAPSSWRVAAPGETGELVVAGPCLMLAFWRAPAATAAVLLPPSILHPAAAPAPTSSPCWLRTRDAAVADATGRVWILGRGADALRVGSETVHAARVEAALTSVPGVAGVIVVGLPDARLGVVPAALVALAPGITWRGAVAPNASPPPPAAGCGTPLSLASLRSAARGAGLPAIALPRAAVATWRGLPARGPLAKPDRAAAAAMVTAALDAAPQAKL